MRRLTLAFAAIALVLAVAALGASVAFYVARAEAEAKTRKAVALQDRSFQVQAAGLADATDVETTRGDAVTALLL